MVHMVDERSDQLADQGVDVIEGDFQDLKSLRSALEGIQRVYYCYPFADGLPKAATLYAKAAREKGVKMTVAMSQMNVHEDSSSPATQNHLAAEFILDSANVGAVHIRPGLFAWNYLNMAGSTIKSNGHFYFPNSQANYTIVHPMDIADVIAMLLASEDFTPHIGKKYILTGDRTFTSSDVAYEISRVIDKPVEYIEIPVESWIEAMKSDPYVNDFLANHLQEFSKAIACGKFDMVTHTIAEIAGHKPRTFSEFVEQHIEHFK